MYYTLTEKQKIYLKTILYDVDFIVDNEEITIPVHSHNMMHTLGGYIANIIATNCYYDFDKSYINQILIPSYESHKKNRLKKDSTSTQSR